LIARCPQCQTRFRLDPAKIGAQGARIRCSKCQTVFRVEPGQSEDATAERPSIPAKPPAETPPAPVSEPEAAKPPPAQPQPQAKAPTAVAAPAGATSRAAAAPEIDPAAPLVLVVESDGDAAKRIEGALRSFGLRSEILSDGAEGLLAIYRKRPRAAVLGGHLPGLTAPVACEIVRRTAELAEVKLIRVAPLDEPAGAPEFEADRIVEPGELVSGIEGALEGLSLGRRQASPVAAEPTPEAAPATAPTAAPAAPKDPQIAAAERLARIIVSDIVLYNQEKFEAAAANGNVATALEAELAEASSLFKQRIPEEVRAKRDFLIEELERRAKRSS